MSAKSSQYIASSTQAGFPTAEGGDPDWRTRLKKAAISRSNHHLSSLHACYWHARDLFQNMRTRAPGFFRPSDGVPYTSRPECFDSWPKCIACCLVTFASLSLLAGLSELLLKHHEHFVLIAYSFGSTVTLLFAAPDAAVSQPFNVMVGQIVSVLSALVVSEIFGGRYGWLAGPTACACAIFLMLALGAVHPPASATALAMAATIDPIAVKFPSRWDGWIRIFFPIVVGSVVLIVFAWLFNNLLLRRHYPDYWWPTESTTDFFHLLRWRKRGHNKPEGDVESQQDAGRCVQVLPRHLWLRRAS